MSNQNNYQQYQYKGIGWYKLLGFSWNKVNASGLSREEYCSKYIEVAYQNCLAMLNRRDLTEINLFYKIPSFNYHCGKIEDIEELREKITEVYHTLKDPEKRKEYNFENSGIFYYEYPEDEVADEKFKDKAILDLERTDSWDEAIDGGVHWKKYLSANYWKNWREQIKTFQYKEEIKFYIRKRGELREFILESTDYEGKPRMRKPGFIENYAEKIKQKESELQNLTKEQWWKAKNKPPRDSGNNEWREMTTKETLETFFSDLPDYGWDFTENEQKKTNDEKVLTEKYNNKLNSISTEELRQQENELRQWMKEKNIDKISLEKNGKLLFYKFLAYDPEYKTTNNWTWFGDESLANSLKTKIKAVEAILFFGKSEKNSISIQELNKELPTNSSEITTKDQNNFTWTPWLVGGGILISAVILFFILRKKAPKKRLWRVI